MDRSLDHNLVWEILHGLNLVLHGGLGELLDQRVTTYITCVPLILRVEVVCVIGAIEAGRGTKVDITSLWGPLEGLQMYEDCGLKVAMNWERQLESMIEANHLDHESISDLCVAYMAETSDYSLTEASIFWSLLISYPGRLSSEGQISMSRSRLGGDCRSRSAAIRWSLSHSTARTEYGWRRPVSRSEGNRHGQCGSLSVHRTSWWNP